MAIEKQCFCDAGKELTDPRVLTDVGDVPVQEIRDCGVDDERLMKVVSESVKLVMEEVSYSRTYFSFNPSFFSSYLVDLKYFNCSSVYCSFWINIQSKYYLQSLSIRIHYAHWF